MAIQEVVVKVPDQILIAEKSEPSVFGKELAMLPAVKLFELGRLSSGRAAELAGISRVAFLESLSKYEVFPLAAELADLEQAHAGH